MGVCGVGCVWGGVCVGRRVCVGEVGWGGVGGMIMIKNISYTEPGPSR